MLLIFVPLNWAAPTGPVSATIGSARIAPSVSGVVEAVDVEGGQRVAEGDPLFHLDASRFQAALDEIDARLALARDRLDRREALAERGTVSETEVQSLETDVAALEAQRRQAEIDLESTVVRAPFDGVPSVVALRPGDRVGPQAPVMAFLDIDEPYVGLVLPQRYVRHVQPGDPAEAVFAIYPGRTFEGTVRSVLPSNPAGEYSLSGVTPAAPDIVDAAYLVELDLNLEGLPLPPGASGAGAVYTRESPQLHVLRQILLRMTTWINFF
jgi:RND family efflux transporter MFP subunit